MSNKIEGVPEGWEFVGIRKAKKGEFSICGSVPKPKQWEFDTDNVYPIIRKLPEPLKVEAGKYYKQRGGKVVGPMISAFDGSRWPWTTTKEYGDQWNDAGKRCIEGAENTDLVEEAPAPYRPFASAEEFKPFRDKWIQRKPEEGGRILGAFQTTSYNDEGCYTGDDYTFYADLLAWTFEDGTPCGIKQ